MTQQTFRVLFVITPPFHPTSGGVQMSTWKIARYLISRGHSVTVFSFTSDGHSLLKGSALETVAHAGGSTAKVNLDKLKAAIERFQPDAVINQMPYEHQIGDVLKADKRYLLLGCLRNTLYSVKGDLDGFVDRALPRHMRPFFRNALAKGFLLRHHRRTHGADLRRILHTYDYFVMFGPPNLDELAYFVPEYDHRKVLLIPNSIPAIAETVPHKENRLLWLGRLTQAQKRAELIPAVWRKVCQELPDWHLDVVGDGPERANIERRIVELKLPRVVFYGRQSPDEYYRRAAIFFMTSAFEGFPNTLVEAQSYAAIPVVFDSYPLARWILGSGGAASLVEPFDVEAMAQQIITIATAPEREEIGNRALENARRFHIDCVGKQWENILQTKALEFAQRH